MKEHANKTVAGCIAWIMAKKRKEEEEGGSSGHERKQGICGVLRQMTPAKT
jgi:hypothetical protein